MRSISQLMPVPVIELELALIKNYSDLLIISRAGRSYWLFGQIMIQQLTERGLAHKFRLLARDSKQTRAPMQYKNSFREVH